MSFEGERNFDEDYLPLKLGSSSIEMAFKFYSQNLNQQNWGMT
jgi:hypothetical protein